MEAAHRGIFVLFESGHSSRRAYRGLNDDHVRDVVAAEMSVQIAKVSRQGFERDDAAPVSHHRRSDKGVEPDMSANIEHNPHTTRMAGKEPLLRVFIGTEPAAMSRRPNDPALPPDGPLNNGDNGLLGDEGQRNS